jgi:ArsR family transcriptional regulator
MVTVLAEGSPAAPAAADQELEECCAPADAPAESPLREDEAARHAGVLKALADPHRLRMLALIAAQPADAPLCQCDVEARFALSQPTVSHHLRVLREAGLIAVTKRGLWHYYAPAPGGLAPVRGLLAALDAGGPAHGGAASR